jgi:hypothetical protein
MSQLNYQLMSDNELREYVIYHPEDKEAFYTYIDRSRKLNPNAVPMALEQAEVELRNRILSQG